MKFPTRRNGESILRKRGMSGGEQRTAQPDRLRLVNQRQTHPPPPRLFNTNDTKTEYNASEPVNDRKHWLDQLVHLIGHTGNYSRRSDCQIDKERTLPRRARVSIRRSLRSMPTGRVFTDEVIDYRLAFLTKGEYPPSGLNRTPTFSREFFRTSARRIRSVIDLS